MTTVGNIIAAVAILFLVAAGLAIIFGVLRIVNFAHGDFVMAGALMSAIGGEQGLPFVLTVVLAAGVGAALACALVLLGITGKRIDAITGLLVTWAFGTVIRDGVAALFGAHGRFVATPVDGRVEAFGGAIPTYVLVLGVVAVVIAVGLYWLFSRTLVGKRMRASVDDRQMAEGVGLRTGRIAIAALALGGALAGLAGALLSPMVSVDPFMGFSYIVRAFLTIVLGGLGSIAGAGVGAVGLGSAETLLTTITSSIAAQLVVFGGVALVLVLRSRLAGRPS